MARQVRSRTQNWERPRGDIVSKRVIEGIRLWRVSGYDRRTRAPSEWLPFRAARS
jgi:hypothetical protein